MRQALRGLLKISHSGLTSRSQKLGLRHANIEVYNNTIIFLNKFIYLFTTIKIGQKPSWKPIQTAVLMSSTSAIEIQNIMLKENNYQYFLLGRLTQDALENLFACIRMKNPVPQCKEFKIALRTIMMSQYFSHNTNYNYTDDDDNNDDDDTGLISWQEVTRPARTMAGRCNHTATEARSSDVKSRLKSDTSRTFLCAQIEHNLREVKFKEF